MNEQSNSVEEDQMKRLIICKLCHETLEDPIILPCGKTICSKHLLNETNNFKCNICDNSHDKTIDKFPVNEIANELVQISDDYVDLNLVDLDPSFYINDYFTKLRNEIDLSKEQLIKDIEHKYEQMITKLKEIERKCTLDAQSKKFNKIDEIIIEEKKKLMEWSLLIKANYNRGSCCADISLKSSESISELKYQIEKFQAALLDYKHYKFKSIQMNDPILGDLITNDVEAIDGRCLEVALIQTLTGHTEAVNESIWNESLIRLFHKYSDP